VTWENKSRSLQEQGCATWLVRSPNGTHEID
jgi:hypothetical protein